MEEAPPLDAASVADASSLEDDGKPPVEDVPPAFDAPLDEGIPPEDVASPVTAPASGATVWWNAGPLSPLHPEVASQSATAKQPCRPSTTAEAATSQPRAQTRTQARCALGSNVEEALRRDGTPSRCDRLAVLTGAWHLGVLDVPCELGRLFALW
jgi:hypothetical protein